MTEANETNNEKDYPLRIKVQQSAKGFHYWEIVVKAEDEAMLESRLNNSIKLAQARCEDLNKVLV